MFSGIVEEDTTGVELEREAGNLHLTLKCSFTEKWKIDQSVAHNGVCLTVVSLPGEGTYTVIAIKETLERRNLGKWNTGDKINLERSTKMNGRIEGHIDKGNWDLTDDSEPVSSQELT